MKKISLIFNILTIIILGYFAYNITKANDDNYMPSISKEKLPRNFDLRNNIKDLDETNIENNFPYVEYVSSQDFLNYTYFKQDLDEIKSKTKNDSKAQEILYKALTDTLDKFKHEQFTANLDSMIYLFQWADKYRVYSDIDTTNAILYSAIHEFWITKISDKLKQLSKDNSTILTNFKFKFLVAKCDEIKYNTPLKISSTTKVVNYFIQKKWAHLFQASWNQASKLQISILFLFLTITIFSYIILIKYFLKSKNN
jgi:hypothetical protein